jgi:hypothetical protein
MLHNNQGRPRFESEMNSEGGLIPLANGEVIQRGHKHCHGDNSGTILQEFIFWPLLNLVVLTSFTFPFYNADELIIYQCQCYSLKRASPSVEICLAQTDLEDARLGQFELSGGHSIVNATVRVFSPVLARLLGRFS